MPSGPTCNECVFKFNELLGNPSPCNCCMRMSEYIPIDDELYREAFWLEDPIVCNKIMDIIDDVVQKVDDLDTLLPDKGVNAKGEGFVTYLKILKELIAENYIDQGDLYGPCIGEDECRSCTKQQCDPNACPF